MARLVYSWTCRQPFAGSASESPPSPPKLEPITVSPARSTEAPLSWRPPETTVPALAGSLPTETE
ncbi:hypothetical protein [Micromonospora sp. ATA51]|uniref:hypothetical protein n=1 Tax=Micromonospora sp. ATA51 TaxID=2806098 RepID=UPI001A5ED4BD|nr:hypothetical protein [Micromonospora sp. ATA51]MBM0227654.1 hypothetical protein [Micromonospora sp. ATA51]